MLLKSFHCCLLFSFSNIFSFLGFSLAFVFRCLEEILSFSFSDFVDSPSDLSVGDTVTIHDVGYDKSTKRRIAKEIKRIKKFDPATEQQPQQTRSTVQRPNAVTGKQRLTKRHGLLLLLFC